MSRPAAPRPYIGTRAYDAAGAPLFAGRDAESEALADAWLTGRATILSGPAGVGRTSLLRAGVMPRVAPRADVLPLGRVAHVTAPPFGALRRHNPFTFAVLRSFAPNAAGTWLSERSVADYLLDRAGGSRVLVALDDVESLFRDPDDRAGHRRGFLAQLQEALRVVPGLHLLFSVREKRLADLLAHLAEVGVDPTGSLRLDPLGRSPARAALLRPAAAVGVTVPEAVADRLVGELLDGGPDEPSASGVEPTQLQLVGLEIWDALPPHADSATDVDADGAADRALRRLYADAVRYVAADQRVPVSELDDWVRAAFVDDAGRRVRVEASSAVGMPPDVFGALEDRHLLLGASGTGQFELASARLATVVWSLRSGPDTAPEPQPAGDPLRAAKRARADGDLGTAAERGRRASRALAGQPRAVATAESFLGDVAVEAGQLAEAEEHYRSAAEIYESLEDTAAVGPLLAALGELRLRRGKITDALAQLRGAVARLPGSLEVRLALARALWQAGQLRGAAGVYGAVLTVAPDSPAALDERGQLRADLGEAGGALEDLGNLARLRPEIAARPGARSAHALALAMAERGSIIDAKQEALAAAAAEPRGGQVLIRAAAVAARANDPGNAATLLERAEAAEPRPQPRQVAEVRRLLLELTSASDQG